MTGRRAGTVAGIIAVLILFCAPLFVGLANADLGSDEALYSYAVERILDTGDWLTPQLLPYDRPFLEKPPLKLWLVAAAIQAHLVPRDEFGLRFFDAVFGSVAFIYVFLLTRSMHGALAGVIAVFVLFTIEPLLFDHGLRSHNMEAALLLSYCGGMYHFARWVEGGTPTATRVQLFAVTAYFVLGFMTKFVAVLFLPLVCVIVLAARNDWRRLLQSGWRDWSIATIAVFAVSAPWFAYHAMETGDAIWREMFGVHIVQRFTSVLDPSHIQPWYYYYSETWSVMGQAGSEWLGLLGIVTLAVNACVRGHWRSLLLLAWWVVPFVAIAFGTSKVFHYAYPFLPPIAIGAATFITILFLFVEDRIARLLQNSAGYWRRFDRVGVWPGGGQVLGPAKRRPRPSGCFDPSTLLAVCAAGNRYCHRILDPLHRNSWPRPLESGGHPDLQEFFCRAAGNRYAACPAHRDAPT